MKWIIIIMHHSGMGERERERGGRGRWGVAGRLGSLLLSTNKIGKSRRAYKLRGIDLARSGY